MSGPVEINGTMTTFDDVARLRQRKLEIESELQRVFMGFDPARIDALLPHEPRLVALHNEYTRAAETIAMYEDKAEARRNIEEVWKLYVSIVRGTSA